MIEIYLSDMDKATFHFPEANVIDISTQRWVNSGNTFSEIPGELKHGNLK
jgi:hypothetical protein